MSLEVCHRCWENLQIGKIERCSPAQAIVTAPVIKRAKIRSLCDGHDLIRVGPTECAATVASVERIERDIDGRTSERRTECDDGDRLITIPADSRVVAIDPRTRCWRPVDELQSPTIDLTRLTSECTAWGETGGRIPE